MLAKVAVIDDHATILEQDTNTIEAHQDTWKGIEMNGGYFPAGEAAQLLEQVQRDGTFRDPRYAHRRALREGGPGLLRDPNRPLRFGLSVTW